MSDCRLVDICGPHVRRRWLLLQLLDLMLLGVDRSDEHVGIACVGALDLLSRSNRDVGCRRSFLFIRRPLLSRWKH